METKIYQRRKYLSVFQKYIQVNASGYDDYVIGSRHNGQIYI